jgi:hypothetical protein
MAVAEQRIGDSLAACLTKGRGLVDICGRWQQLGDATGAAARAVIRVSAGTLRKPWNAWWRWQSTSNRPLPANPELQGDSKEMQGADETEVAKSTEFLSISIGFSLARPAGRLLVCSREN